jgi:hypothetical protein
MNPEEARHQGQAVSRMARGIAWKIQYRREGLIDANSVRECPESACAVQRRRFPVGAVKAKLMVYRRGGAKVYQWVEA